MFRVDPEVITVWREDRKGIRSNYLAGPYELTRRMLEEYANGGQELSIGHLIASSIQFEPFWRYRGRSLRSIRRRKLTCEHRTEYNCYHYNSRDRERDYYDLFFRQLVTDLFVSSETKLAVSALAKTRVARARWAVTAKGNVRVSTVIIPRTICPNSKMNVSVETYGDFVSPVIFLPCEHSSRND